MPLQFAYSHKDFVINVRRKTGNDPREDFPPTPFDTTIKTEWTDRQEKGLLRYTLGDLQTRILPGPHYFVAQLNEKRGIERRKPQAVCSIRQKFNGELFNFNKIKPDEVILEMSKSEGCSEEDGETAPCKMVVLVNVSPLEFGHSLFVPDPPLCLPQVLTRFAIQSGIESVLMSSDPGFRMGFNSLGAFASVNHLHLHGYYLDHELYIETVPVTPLLPDIGFYSLSDFPAGFVFYAESGGVDEVAKAVCRVTDFLVDADVCHNLFLTRGCPPYSPERGRMDRSLRSGVRIVVWPKIACFGAKEETAFNVALCELAGHLPFKNVDEYERATEDGVLDIIQKFLPPKEDFLKLEQQITQHLRDK
ncbi:GDP-D-glucose phosphorylase 1 [Neosynchiropus ocellatus]